MLNTKGKFVYTVKGVTLLELMLVLIAIIGILVFSSKLFFDAQNKNYTIAMANELQNVLNAADRYAAFNSNTDGGYMGFSNSNVPNLPNWLGWFPSTNTVLISGTAPSAFQVRVMWGPLRDNCYNLANFLKNQPNWTFSCGGYHTAAVYSKK